MKNYTQIQYENISKKYFIISIFSILFVTINKNLETISIGE